MSDLPVPPSRAAQLTEFAGDLLESGEPLRALEIFRDAERLAVADGDEALLCGLLGDEAVAFRRVGNLQRAIGTYQRAIEYCRKHGDILNLSRWTGNLGEILLQQGNTAAAEACFREELSAAVQTGRPDQLSIAVANIARVLSGQERYEEAYEVLCQALSAEAGDPALRDLLATNAFILCKRWADRLADEGQLDEALDAYERGLTRLSLADDQQKLLAAEAHIHRAELFERLFRVQGALHALDSAIVLFEDIGANREAHQLETVRQQLATARPSLAGPESAPNDIDQLEREIESAAAAGDRQAEATARVNLANSLLQVDQAKAVGALNEALALVRQMQDRRRELILLLNFTPAILYTGDTSRALQMATRALALAETAPPAHQVLAALNAGQAWAEGVTDIRAAASHYRSGTRLLDQMRASDPAMAASLIDGLKGPLSAAARTLLNAGFMHEATALATLIDPSLAATLERLEQEHRHRAILSLDELLQMTDVRLDSLLAAWRGTPLGADATQLREISDLADTLGWNEAAARLRRIQEDQGRHHPRITGRALESPASAGASSGGPAAILHLAELLTDARVDRNEAARLASAMRLSDDDVEFLALFSLWAGKPSVRTGFEMMRLTAPIVTEPLLAGRLYRVLAMLAGVDGDHEEAFKFNLQGDARLAGLGEARPGTLAVRATLQNEAAVSLLTMRRPEEARQFALSAKALAEQASNGELAAMATGNVGVALMALERWDEAVATFEHLVTLQEAHGDDQGLATTRLNMSACYAKLGRTDRVQFDAESDDPDVLFNRASHLALTGDMSGAINMFKQAFRAVAAAPQPYPREPEVRMNYARTLYSAGRVREAVEQMVTAARLWEESGNDQHLHEAYSWLAEAAVNWPVTGEAYAERAVQLGRALSNPAELAVDLGQLGRARLASGKAGLAVEALQEAAKLAGTPGTHLDPPLRANLAAALGQALTADARAAEAIPLFERLLEETPIGEADLKCALLVALAEAHGRLLHWEQELRLLREASTLSDGSGLEAQGALTASHLGLALLRAGRLEEAATILERGFDRARKLGRTDLEINILSHLGSVLKEMGDLEGASSTLRGVRSRARAEGMLRLEAVALASLGNVVALQRNYTEARALYLEGADLAGQISDRAIEATCLDGAGTMYRALGEANRAVEYHLRASRLHQAIELWDDQLSDVLNLVQTHLALGELELARIRRDEALSLLRLHELKQPWELVMTSAQVEASAGAWSRARTLFRKVIAELEDLRGSLTTPAQQRQWAAEKSEVYQAAAAAAITAEDGPAAVEFIECSRVRFLEAVLARHSNRPQDISEETWQQYEQAAAHRSELHARRRARLVSPGTISDSDLKDAEARFGRALAAVQQENRQGLGTAPVFEFPRWRELVRVIPAGWVVTWIGCYDAGLGIVCAGKDGNRRVWARAKMDPSFTSEDLNRLIFGDGLRFQGWAHGSTEEGENEAWAQTVSFVCQTLGKRMWPAVFDLLPEDGNQIVLIPSAGFSVLPLHAAVLPGGTRVDDRLCVRYAPSLGTLRWARTHGRTAGPAPRRARLAQAVNPTQDAGLPFSGLEARLAARAFDPPLTTTVPGRAGTVARVLPLLKQADVFHFAGHGFYDPEEPFRSGLFCSPQGNDSGILSLRAILDEIGSLRAACVVLSACETGRLQPDDQLNDSLGLPGGFLVAGAQAVVAALWRVDDLASCLLVGKFFELWTAGGRSEAEALRDAQRWLRGLSVADLVGILTAGIELDHGNEEIQEELRFWQAEPQRDARPFEEEVYWAPFYVTGLVRTPRRSS